jgi:DNA excision repair protein ERCC-2
MYPKMLGFSATVMESYAMTLTRDCFLPLVVTRGNDQVPISSRFEVRNDPSVVRNFGTLLIEYCKIVPDGIVVFFPSYLYMESIVAAWNDMASLGRVSSESTDLMQGILNEAWKHKLIFVETPDAAETSIALENYRRVCYTFRTIALDIRTGMRQWPRSSLAVCRARQSVGGHRFRSQLRSSRDKYVP